MLSRRLETLSQCDQEFLARLKAEDFGIGTLRATIQDFSVLMRSRDPNG